MKSLVRITNGYVVTFAQIFTLQHGKISFIRKKKQTYKSFKHANNKEDAVVTLHRKILSVVLSLVERPWRGIGHPIKFCRTSANNLWKEESSTVADNVMPSPSLSSSIFHTSTNLTISTRKSMQKTKINMKIAYFLFE